MFQFRYNPVKKKSSYMQMRFLVHEINFLRKGVCSYFNKKPYIYVYVKSPLFWLLCWFKIVFKKYPHRTYDISTVYPQRTYSVPTTYPQRTYNVPTTYLQRTHNVPTTYPQCTHKIPLKTPA